jgi:hypothetical protein
LDEFGEAAAEAEPVESRSAVSLVSLDGRAASVEVRADSVV